MKTTFAIVFAPGSSWNNSKTVREQAYWTEHAAFMDELFANGTVFMGGPFIDGTGSLVLVETEMEENEVRSLFANDPFIEHQIFVLRSLKQWQLFLDAR